MKDTMPHPLRMMIAALVLSAGLPDLGRAGDTSANVPVTEIKFFDTGIARLRPRRVSTISPRVRIALSLSCRRISLRHRTFILRTFMAL